MSGPVDNRPAWNSGSVAATYAKSSSLMPAELAVFAEAWDKIRDARVLDIGVGGGRTLPYLRGPARHYIAVDYSQAMVEACRGRYPEADVRLGDACDLASIADASVDFAFFSYNSIDCIAAEKRAEVYGAARRVLAPGGLFGFSSHNVRCLRRVPSAFSLPEIEWTAQPLKMGVRLLRAGAETVRSYQNHKRLAAGERRGDGYAIVNDGAHEFSMLFVYADPTWQVGELLRAGFEDVRVFDQRGRQVAPSVVADEWVHYLARRP
jgi:SAM-dependent methyltransferase